MEKLTHDLLNDHIAAHVSAASRQAMRSANKLLRSAVPKIDVQEAFFDGLQSVAKAMADATRVLNSSDTFRFRISTAVFVVHHKKIVFTDMVSNQVHNMHRKFEGENMQRNLFELLKEINVPQHLRRPILPPDTTLLVSHCNLRSMDSTTPYFKRLQESYNQQLFEWRGLIKAARRLHNVSVDDDHIAGGRKRR